MRPERPIDEPKLKAFVQEARWNLVRAFIGTACAYTEHCLSGRLGLGTMRAGAVFYRACGKAK